MMNSNLSLVLLSAGESSRFGASVKKQWLRVNNSPLWLNVLRQFKEMNYFKKIVITAHRDEVALFQNFTDVEVVVGGNNRQESIKQAVENVDTEFVVISDIARCIIPKDMVNRLIENRYSGDVVVPYLPVTDTVVVGDKNVNRDSVKLIQTPQISKLKILKKLLKNDNRDFTDESSLFVANGYKRAFVLGDKRAEKLTYLKDIKGSECFKKGFKEGIRVGNGFDVHQFQIDGDRELKLGGVSIETPLSFKAHSDGDVLIHSLIDAILGGAGVGDIGEMFPDSDERYRNIDSVELLNIVYKMIQKIGIELVNIDITVMAEIPKLKKYKDKIRDRLSNALKIEKSSINVKATTTEKLGFIGRKEGVGVITTVTLRNIDWREFV